MTVTVTGGWNTKDAELFCNVIWVIVLRLVCIYASATILNFFGRGFRCHWGEIGMLVKVSGSDPTDICSRHHWPSMDCLPQQTCCSCKQVRPLTDFKICKKDGQKGPTSKCTCCLLRNQKPHQHMKWKCLDSDD